MSIHLLAHTPTTANYKALRDLTCKRLQFDEIWSFCYSKAKNVPEEHRGEWGCGALAVPRLTAARMLTRTKISEEQPYVFSVLGPNLKLHRAGDWIEAAARTTEAQDIAEPFTLDCKRYLRRLK